MQSYDIVIPCASSNLNTLIAGIPFFIKYIEPKRIVVVSDEASLSRLESQFGNSIDNLVLLNEKKLCGGLTKTQVGDYVDAKMGKHILGPGWYYQQFLKMGYCYYCADSAYLIWDADVIPLRKIDHVEGSKYILYLERGVEGAYSEWIKCLFGPNRTKYEGTYVVDQMIFDTEYMKELIGLIMEKVAIPGRTESEFWKSIIDLMDPEDIDNHVGFSEYETYGQFMVDYHPDSFVTKPRISCNCNGMKYLGSRPSEDLLSWVGNELDSISFEKFVKEGKIYPCLCRFLHSKVPFSTIIKPYEMVVRERSRFSYRRKKLGRLLFWNRR